MGQQNELQIVFIYDCLRNQKEEDDPFDSIIYFHPKEISHEKRVAICGQLMGVTQFLNETFSSPTILTLQNGKFSIRPIDSKKQYLLALGCSSGTPDWILQKQATLLQQLLLFFHGDLMDLIIKECRRISSSNSATSKLNTMIQHYIPLSQCNGDLFALTFGILPMLHLPKSANTIPLQATILLHTCMMKKGVLGGIVTYQTKVIGLEIGQPLAQKIALIQPYKTPPADSVHVDFRLPLGVQLIFIYITKSDLASLTENYSRFQQQPSASKQAFGAQASRNMKTSGGIGSIQEEPLNDTFKSMDEDGESNLIEKSKVSDSDYEQRPVKKATKSVDIIGYRKSLEDLSSIAIPSMNPNPLRRCSSIADPLYPYIYPNGKCLTISLVNSFNEELSNDKAKDLENDDCEDDEDEEEVRSVKSNSPIAQAEESASTTLEEVAQIKPSTTVPIPIPTQLNEASNEKGSPETGKVKAARSKSESTIQSPNNIASTSSFSSNVRRPIDLPLLSTKTAGGALRKKQRLWKTFDDMLSPNECPTIHNGPQNDIEILTRVQAAASSTESMHSKPIIINDSVHQRLINSFRKLSSHDDGIDDGSQFDEKQSSTASNNSSIFYSSCENNPDDPDTEPDERSGRGVKLKDHELPESMKSGPTQPVCEKYEKEILFIYCIGPMRLLLVLDVNVKLDSEFINSLREHGSSTLTDLKEALLNIMEDPTVQFSTQSNPYCFLNYDSVWKTLTHSGRNETMDFNTVQQMHQDFITCPQIHELVIRGEDHAIYGYQCVGSEVYYQQSSAGLQPGLPMPTDLMGKVPTKAKRRLERDHSILLL